MNGYLTGARVLVTGAAGSVGARLCARLAELEVEEIVALDACEGGLVELARALELEQGFDRVVPALGDVRNAIRVTQVCERHRPEIVFHAAAYKQVPLLESHPVEAASTNVFGTAAVASAAHAAGAARFVLFSSDKAVQPTSVLGLTKAIAEWIAGSFGYAAVRLANVAESTGSIIPLFRRQAQLGGPVTVTDRRATRYVITLDDAVRLALAAGELGEDGGIFWLDCSPVRIVDIACRVADGVPIEFVGLRDGDRLHEQLRWSGEEAATTSVEGVMRSPTRRVDPGWLSGWLDVLRAEVDAGSADGARATLESMLEEAALGRPEAVAAT